MQKFMLYLLTWTPISMPHNSTVGNKIPSSLSHPFMSRLFLNTEVENFLYFDHAVYSVYMYNFKNLFQKRY